MPPVAARRATAAVFVLNGFVLGMWVVNIPEVLDRTGASKAELGTLLLVMGGSALAGMQLAGYLVDRHGSRPVAAVASLVSCAALLGPSLVSDVGTLAVALAVFGLANGAVDVAQPDLGSCGGISAGRHIIAIAQSHGVQVNPHVWGSAIAQAASLQLLAAVPVAHHSLFAQEPILEFDRSSHPFRVQLITRPIQQVNGWVEIPSGPGLGVEVDRSVLERFK